MTRRSKGSGTLVDRGGGRWGIRLDLGRDPRTGKRIRRNVAFTGIKAAAQKRMTELLRERDDGATSPPTRLTVGEWLQTWLPRHFADARITSRTYDRYNAICRQHLIPALGRTSLQDLRPSHISAAKADWLTGSAKSTASKTLAPATVQKHLVVLRRALKDALNDGLISRNPCDAVSNPSVSQQQASRALEETEISALLAAAQGTRFDVPIRFALATGLRQGEMLELRWLDVDVDGAFLSVRGTKTKNSKRQVELSAATIRRLRAHRMEQREHRLRLGGGWNGSELIFPNVFGAPWNRRIFYRDYKTLVNRSGIFDPRSVTWHVLRHTAASQWIHHGIDIFTVSRRLGHASSSFTMDRYGHLLKGQQRGAAEALDHLLA